MKENILHSIFDVLGNKETALSRSLATILYKDKLILNRFIKKAFPKVSISFNSHLIGESLFYFEKEHGKLGRTDIEIENNFFHLVIETKTRSGKVTASQARKYSKILCASKSKHKFFVFLTEIDDPTTIEQIQSQFPQIYYSKISWASIYALLKKRKNIHVNLVEEAMNSLKWRHEMKIHDIDIWAVVVRRKEETNLEKHHVYRNYKFHTPIFIAKRERDTKRKKVVIYDLYPVLQIHAPHSSFAKKYNQNNGKDYLYELGRKMTLTNPIIKKFSQASAIALSFQDF